MKILLASPERDLLECYKTLFEDDLGQTVTAFDGVQVLSLLSSENFDTAVLDSDLPRTEYGKLIAQMREKNIPVIALINEPKSVWRQRKEPDANAYLSYPFDYDQIKNVICDTINKTKKGAVSENE